MKWLTSGERVLSLCQDKLVTYQALNVVDVTKEYVTFVQIVKPSFLVSELPKYDIDLPIRHFIDDKNFFKNPPFLKPRSTFPNKSFEFLKFNQKNNKMYTPYALNLIDLGPTIPWCTNSNSPLNQYLAFRKRISSVRPTINLVKLNLLRIFVLKYLKQNLIPLPYLDYEELFEVWLDENKSYTLARKKQLREAKRRLFDENFNLLFEEPDYNCKSFIKREFYEFAKYCRLINSRTDKFKAYVGPYIHYLEKIVYQIKHFVKGTNPLDLPEKIVKLSKYPYFLESDYSSFESSFDPMYTDVVECQLWRYMFVNNPKVLSIIMGCYYVVDNGILRPRVQNLRSVSYTARVVGARMSGDMWTSLGNGFSNLMNILFLADYYNIELDGFVEGDDGIFGMDKDIIRPSDFEDLGFNIKMKVNTDLELTDFCGSVFCKSTMHLLSPPEQITRLAWTNSSKYFRSGNEILTDLLRAKCQSAYVQGKYTPILGPLCLKILEFIGQGSIVYETSTKWWDMQLLKCLEKETFQPEVLRMEDRLLYFKRFGISLETQFLFEKIIKEAKNIRELYLPYYYLEFNYESGTCYC